MARHDVKRLPVWEECRRCDRHRTRLGVLATAWPPGTRVVVLGLAASRAAQATGTYDPRLLRGVEALTEALGLAAGECVPDVLVACGLGEVAPDDVAACSARFSQQSVVPDVIVFRDRRSVDVAAGAGLIDGGMWTPLGAPSIPWVFDDELSQVVSRVGHYLGRTVVPSSTAASAKLADRADALRLALGGHAGVGTLAGSKWRRAATGALTQVQVRGHLGGDATVAPFRPKGPWPFVVIDVDRHDALQEKRFVETCKQVRALFPHAFDVQSSQSGGRHFYVKLATGTSYERGALVVRAFLSLRKVRWTDEGPLRAERAEVPSHPVRLPFGLGSKVPGSVLPIEAQLDKFLSFVRRGRPTDYAAAASAVDAALKFRGAWSPEKRMKLERFLDAEEVATIATRPLEPADPWCRILPALPPALRKIAVSGAPAFGTRVRWTTRLVTALTAIVGPEQALGLMAHWLEHRDHRSESLLVEPDVVKAETERIVRSKYRHAGVPVRFWQHVRSSIDSFFHSRRRKDRYWDSLAERLKKPELVSSEVYGTAFSILSKFYRRNVPVRNIGWREFALGGGRESADAVEALLSDATWLVFTEPAIPNVRSRGYALHPLLWPPRPGEPRTYTPW